MQLRALEMRSWFKKVKSSECKLMNEIKNQLRMFQDHRSRTLRCDFPVLLVGRYCRPKQR